MASKIRVTFVGCRVDICTAFRRVSTTRQSFDEVVCCCTDRGAGGDEGVHNETVAVTRAYHDPCAPIAEAPAAMRTPTTKLWPSRKDAGSLRETPLRQARGSAVCTQITRWARRRGFCTASTPSARHRRRGTRASPAAKSAHENAVRVECVECALKWSSRARAPRNPPSRVARRGGWCRWWAGR